MPSGLEVWDLGFRVRGFRVCGLGFLELRIQGIGFRLFRFRVLSVSALGSGCRTLGRRFYCLGFRV